MTEANKSAAPVRSDGATSPRPARRPYEAPRCTPWGNVVELTEGAGGGAMDLGATSKTI
jgi:hypothetical protein